MTEPDQFQRFEAEQRARRAREAAQRAAHIKLPDQSAEAVTPATPPGWYPHPSMADTRQYWDGQAWTDHIAPGAPTSRPPADPAKVRRVAWLIALAFLLPVVFITFFAVPTYGGEGCGTWLSPRWTDSYLLLEQTKVDAIGGARLAAIADRCNTTQGTHQLICLILIGLAIGSRLLVPPMVRAIRD